MTWLGGFFIFNFLLFHDTWISFFMLILDPSAALESKQILCDKRKGHLCFFLSAPPLSSSFPPSLFISLVSFFLPSFFLPSFLHFLFLPFFPFFPMSFTSLSFYFLLSFPSLKILSLNKVFSTRWQNIWYSFYHNNNHVKHLPDTKLPNSKYLCVYVDS